MVKRFAVGGLLTNCYVYVDEKTNETMIIDPAENDSSIDSFIDSNSLSVVVIVDTHCHFDHVGANAYFKEKYNAPLAIGYYDVSCLKMAHLEARVFGVYIKESPKPDIVLNDDDVINVGNSKFTVIHTPGHTPGSICLYEPKKKILFSGDTLFFESVGRWDLQGGDYAALMESLRKLLSLPDDTSVFPGHGELTTIGHEKKYNPFVK